MRVAMNEAIFVKKLQTLFQSEGFFTKREVGAGYGVADLVVVKKSKIDLQRCKLREDYGQRFALLRPDYFKVLKHIPDENTAKKPVHLDYLITQTGFSDSFLRSTILLNLKKHGYIRRTEEGTFFKINGWLPLAKEVIAVEAKLKDWKRGFLQANRYKSFADKVYLAIPKNVEHLVDRELLKKHGVGLIVLNHQGIKTVSIAAKRNKLVDSYKKHYALELFWNCSGFQSMF